MAMDKEKKVTEEDTSEANTERVLGHQIPSKNSMLVKKKSVPVIKHISKLDMLVRSSVKPENSIVSKKGDIGYGKSMQIPRKNSTQRSTDTFGDADERKFNGAESLISERNLKS